MDFSTMCSQLGSGMAMTITIFGLTLLFSLPLGLGVTFWRMSKNSLVAQYGKIIHFPSCKERL